MLRGTEPFVLVFLDLPVLWIIVFGLWFMSCGFANYWIYGLITDYKSAFWTAYGSKPACRR